MHVSVVYFGRGFEERIEQERSVRSACKMADSSQFMVGRDTAESYRVDVLPNLKVETRSPL